MDLKYLGAKIRELRQADPEYRSLRKYCEAIDKSPTWVSKVERGEEAPTYETLVKIVDVLHGNLDELLPYWGYDPDTKQAMKDRSEEFSVLFRELSKWSREDIKRLKSGVEKKDQLMLALGDLNEENSATDE